MLTRLCRPKLKTRSGTRQTFAPSSPAKEHLSNPQTQPVLTIYLVLLAAKKFIHPSIQP